MSDPNQIKRRAYLDQVFQAERGVDVLNSLSDLRVDDLDELPFGAIRLDHSGRILAFNRAESRLSGYSAASVIGKNFFTEVAPCTNVQEFAGRFHEGVRKRKLHAVFQYRFDFKPRPREVAVTLYYHESTNTTWVLVRGGAADE